jgi:hypothetical protein
MGHSKVSAKELIRNAWTKKASCLDIDTNFFFDKYEDSIQIRHGIDKLCKQCLVRRECLAVGVSRQEYGVWGGVYLDKGKISKDMNNHKSQEDWFDLWSNALMETS